MLGVDISGAMVDAAQRRADALGVGQRRASRAWTPRRSTSPTPSFDVALCALGLMYMPDPARAVREMRRVAAARAAASASRSGASARAAAGRRCSRSSMPKSRATSARCSSASARAMRWRALCGDAGFDVDRAAPHRDDAGLRRRRRSVRRGLRRRPGRARLVALRRRRRARAFARATSTRSRRGATGRRLSHPGRVRRRRRARERRITTATTRTPPTPLRRPDHAA